MLGHWLLVHVFPPRCPACQVVVEVQHNFCAPCFQALRPIADPQCACCGMPFAFSVGVAAQCPECLSAPPSYQRARAALVYDAVSAPLVRALKFHDRYTGLGRAARMMQAAHGDQPVDVVVPVPLHWRRLLTRHYNQAALLAYGVAQQLGRPCAPRALKRTRYTRPQMRMKRAERLKNVRNLFAVRDLAAVQQKHVLLVDDVITTGATVNACAEALLRAGAQSVSVVALAKTVRE
jgi:ComF family protein